MSGDKIWAATLDLASDQCPPAEAVAPSGEYFRLTAPSLALDDLPTKADWILPARKRKGECAGREDLCKCMAHSLFADMSDAVLARELVPNFQKKSIASVSLSNGMGVVVSSPRPNGESHHDWWPEPEDLIPSAVVVDVRA